MDEGDMAIVLAEELNKEPWTAVGLALGEVWFTNEDGEKFVLTVTKVKSFDGDE